MLYNFSCPRYNVKIKNRSNLDSIFYKPADGLLAGFSLCPYVPIALAYFAPCKAAQSVRMALYKLPKMDELFLCNFFVDNEL